MIEVLQHTIDLNFDLRSNIFSTSYQEDFVFNFHLSQARPNFLAEIWNCSVRSTLSNVSFWSINDLEVFLSDLDRTLDLTRKVFSVLFRLRNNYSNCKPRWQSHCVNNLNNLQKLFDTFCSTWLKAFLSTLSMRSFSILKRLAPTSSLLQIPT